MLKNHVAYGVIMGDGQRLVGTLQQSRGHTMPLRDSEDMRTPVPYAEYKTLK